MPLASTHKYVRSLFEHVDQHIEVMNWPEVEIYLRNNCYVD